MDVKPWCFMYLVVALLFTCVSPFHSFPVADGGGKTNVFMHVFNTGYQGI